MSGHRTRFWIFVALAGSLAVFAVSHLLTPPTKEDVLFMRRHPRMSARYSLSPASPDVVLRLEHEKLAVLMWTYDALEKLESIADVHAYLDRARAGQQRIWKSRRDGYLQWAKKTQEADAPYYFEYFDGQASESGYLTLRDGEIVYRTLLTGASDSAGP